jgi:hypothetical protein
MAVVDLWHLREQQLEPGAVIAPGRWGSTITAQGGHQPFFFREHFLELFRLAYTTTPVSRLTCVYAWEDRATADYMRAAGHLYRVEPVEPSAPAVRVDALWLTWMGDLGSTPEQNVSRCQSYWAGKSAQELMPTAAPSWEWLFACGLRVIEWVA